jgi:predicted TIM-barrel fold metal-dependent hydrolase
MNNEYVIKAEWLQLFKDFPDRFMIGTDAFLAGKTEHLDTSVEGTWKFINLLPQELRDKIGGENAARVYGF